MMHGRKNIKLKALCVFAVRYDLDVHVLFRLRTLTSISGVARQTPRCVNV